MQKMRNFFFVLWQMFLSNVLRRPQLDDLPPLHQELLAAIVTLKGVQYSLLRAMIPEATEARINSMVKAGLIEKLVGFLLPTERGAFLINRAKLAHPDNPIHFGFDCNSSMFKYGYTGGEGENQYAAWPMPNNQFIRVADLEQKPESNLKAFGATGSILNPTAPVTVYGLVLEDRYRAAEIHHYVKFNEPVTFHLNDFASGKAERAVQWDNVKAFSPLGGEFVYANIHLELVVRAGVLKVTGKLCHNYGAPVLGVLMQFNYMVNPLLEASAEFLGPKPPEPDTNDEPSDILKVDGLAVHSNIVLSAKEREVMDILYRAECQGKPAGLALGRCSGLDDDFSEGMVNWLVEIGAAVLRPNRVLRITSYGIELLKVPTSNPDNGAGLSVPEFSAGFVQSIGDTAEKPMIDPQFGGQAGFKPESGDVTPSDAVKPNDLAELLSIAVAVSNIPQVTDEQVTPPVDEASLTLELVTCTEESNGLLHDEARLLRLINTVYVGYGFNGIPLEKYVTSGLVTQAVVERVIDHNAVEFFSEGMLGITPRGSALLTNYHLSIGTMVDKIPPTVAAKVLEHIESIFPIVDLTVNEFEVLELLKLDESIDIATLDASVTKLDLPTIWSLEKCNAIGKDEAGAVWLTPYGKRLREARAKTVVINYEEYNLLLEIVKSDKYMEDDGVAEDDKPGFREKHLNRLRALGAIRIAAGICTITKLGLQIIDANVDNDLSPWGEKND